MIQTHYTPSTHLMAWEIQAKCNWTANKTISGLQEKSDLPYDATVFFEASYAAWCAAGHDRVELAKSMLKEAQVAERQEALGAESWTTGTITTKMGNVHKLKNAAGRKAAAALQAAAPNA